MADILNNSSTTATIGVGQTVTNDVEIKGDHDWFRITLTAGQSISVALDGITLEDAYLRIRDASGAVIYENDDTKPGIDRDSLLAFTANYTGTYYIDVSAWEPTSVEPGYTGTGTYALTVSSYSPPPVVSADQVADQLVEGYWDGNDRHFNVTQGGTLTVNLTALTPSGANLARQALAMWTDVIGVSFQEVTTGGQIQFDDNQEGAFSTSVASNHIISSSQVNVSAQWLTDYGTGLTSYSFQTYIHEIGHALGLGHAGNYNGDARYPFDANFLNDSWAMSIMSYFDQSESTYYGDQGFTKLRIVTPMVADLLAMERLYGLSSATRTGDTTYGFNSNADRAIYSAAQYPDVAYAIYDSGGTDTIDGSGATGSQTINLNPETFSNFNGRVGNLSIGRGVIIENAIGGSGADTLTGNAAANLLRGLAGSDFLHGNAGNDILEGGFGTDYLRGGAGADLFVGTRDGLNGDTISDFGLDDAIVFSDASLSSFGFSQNGNTLIFSGGSLDLVQLPLGRIVASARLGGGVQLTVVTMDAANDFNGDGRSDILFRSSSGIITNWLGQSNGDFIGNYSDAYLPLDNSWEVNGTGDFNGDGRDDIFWRSIDGAATDWLGQPNGGFSGNVGVSYHVMATNWQVEGAGDFNGDGRDDVLFRSNDGIVTNWLGQSNGDFFGNYSSAFIPLDTSWQIVGVGDFDGDGRDDILWRHSGGTITNWLGQTNGSFAGNNVNIGMPLNWQVAGVGDFNGDGRDDILWRSSDGYVANWLGQTGGSFLNNYGNLYTQLDTSWEVQGIGDYNGDGRDDVLWRHGSGAVTNWLGQTNGGLVGNAEVSYHVMDNSWHVQASDSLL